ncbi:MAG TPA: TIGR00282 family metallophosphoesterase [Firmicutes bacterium]|nr:TIGR00282 family metallophosphoesterase [Bacillota bacterium]
MRCLFFGDVVGRPGREAVKGLLPVLRQRYSPDLVLANVENAAGGFGVTAAVAEELHSAGVDLMTTGNHVWDKKESYRFLDACPYLVRPANYPPGVPGRGFLLHRLPGCGVGIMNLSGRAFLDPLDDPFRLALELAEALRRETTVILVDFHAEATAEKVAMGWHLDGKVSAVLGTHTHVPTADGRILPQGTAYVTDVGMVGPRDSVLGMETATILQRFKTQMPARFPVASGPVAVNAIFLEVEVETGRALRFEQVLDVWERTD